MAAEQRRQALPEETQARPEDHRRGEDEIEIIEVLSVDDAHQPVVERLVGMAGHFQHE